MKLLISILLLSACGKNRTGQADQCQARKTQVFRCVQNRTYNYGVDYAIRSCNEQFNTPNCGVYR